MISSYRPLSKDPQHCAQKLQHNYQKGMFPSRNRKRAEGPNPTADLSAEVPQSGTKAEALARKEALTKEEDFSDGG